MKITTKYDIGDKVMVWMGSILEYPYLPRILTTTVLSIEVCADLAGHVEIKYSLDGVSEDFNEKHVFRNKEGCESIVIIDNIHSED